jgi:outer membrane protein, multidrug efflux system
MNKALGLALSAAVLSACGSLTPPSQLPALPVAATFVESTPASGAAAADIAWQDVFSDPRLKQRITLALQNNRDLRVAALNIEQVRALYQVRRADELPTLNAGAAASRTPKAGGGITSSYTAGLSVTAYELDFFGRVRKLSEAALAQWLGTQEARNTAQISLIASVANAHFNLLADDALLGVTRQALLSREDSMRLIQLKFDKGAASELELRQAESLLEAAKVSLAQLTRQRAQDDNALVLLVGSALPAEASPAASSPLSLSAELPVGLPSAVLTRRPDVRQAEQLLSAANANIGAARAAFFPRITLTGSAGLASSDLAGLFKGGAFAWSFAPQLLLPIFDAGRNQANLAVAQVNRDIAVAQYEKAVQVAFREVNDALVARATWAEQLRAQQAQARAEAVRLQLAELRYRNGAFSYLEVLDAQRSALTAQQALVQVQVQQAQNGVALYKALGGGWKAEAHGW